MSLKGKKVLVGLTGGIACYKVPYLVRDLHRAKAETRVIMTKAATKFITPLTLEAVSNHPVKVEMFRDNEFVATRHIDLGEWPDVVIVAPATANFLGKIASGISDDLLTTVICASPKPIMIAPAMNPQMWAHPATQKNIAYLQEIGYQILGPGEGDMACDHIGLGRMLEPEELFEAIRTFLAGKGPKKKVLTGKTVVVTAGPCREPIDPVRYITNRSSGKMGYALASAAKSLGARTILISGPTSLTPPSGVDFISIETTAQMHKAVKRHFAKTDCLIMAAAPADFSPGRQAGQKIKKNGEGMQLSLKPTVDILKEMGLKKKKGQVLVGFALETENGVANARRKLKEKNLDLIVLNNPRDKNSAFDHDTNKISLIRPGRKPDHWELQQKSAVASKLLESIASML